MVQLKNYLCCLQQVFIFFTTIYLQFISNLYIKILLKAMMEAMKKAKLQNDLIPESIQEKKTQSVHYIKKTCDGQNEAITFCINLACPEENPFICNSGEKDKQCVCYKAHYLCARVVIDAAQKEIQKKVDKKQNNAAQRLNQTIDYLSQFRQKLEDTIKYVSLSQDEKRFRSFFTDPNLECDMNSKQLSSMWASIKVKPQIQQQVDQIVKKQLRKLHETIQKSCLQIQEKIKQVSTQNKEQKRQSISNKIQKPLEIAPLRILDENNAKQCLISFLSEKKVNKFELTFKASQHQFSIAKYYEICGSLQNTVIICKIQEKIFGGFTPLSFNLGENEKQEIQQVCDPSGQSFLFSINQSSKFKNIINTGAIVRCKKKNVISFCRSLYIFDKLECYFNLDDNYYNTEAYPNKQQSYLKLTGSKTFECKLAQWEVYQVHFQ